MLQITTLLNSREKPIHNDKQLRAIVRIGQSVNFAIERFASVGEAIAEDNAEIRADMFEACKDARAAGSLIEQLCSLTAPSLRSSSAAGFIPDPGDCNDANFQGSPSLEFHSNHSYRLPLRSENSGQASLNSSRLSSDRTAMYRSAKALLSSVTRVLLIADTVVVKQLLASKDRVSSTKFYLFLIFSLPK